MSWIRSGAACLVGWACLPAWTSVGLLAGPNGWSCRVADPAGKPVAGAEIFVRQVDDESRSVSLLWAPRSWQSLGKVTRLGVSDARGRVETASLREGLYEIAVRAEGFGPLVLSGVWAGVGREDPREPFVLNPVSPAAGRVIDEQGRGVAGASVHLLIHDPSLRGRFPRIDECAMVVASTDERGEFQFSAVEAGRQLDLLASKKGYAGSPLEGISLGKESRGLRLILRRGGAISGAVGFRGIPQARVAVRLVSNLEGGPPGSRVALTDEDGRFRFDDLEPGLYVALVSEGGSAGNVFERELEVSAGATTEARIEFQAAAIAGSFEEVAAPVYTGQVVGPDGHGIAGAALRILGEEEPVVFFSGADGKVQLADIAPGLHVLQIEKAGYFFSPALLSLGEKSSRDFVWRLKKAPARAQGKVVGLAADELPGLEVYAYGEPLGPTIRGETGGGRFQIDGLAAGRWTLTAKTPKSCRTAYRQIELAEGKLVGEATLDFAHLAAPWVASIRRAGKPAENVTFQVSSQASANILCEGFSAGGKIELLLPAGRYNLLLHAGDIVRDLPIEAGAAQEPVIELTARQ